MASYSHFSNTKMEALKEVNEIMVNQNRILEAVKYLHERLEEVTENRNSDKSDVKNIIESQAMVDGIIVKNSDDIKVLLKTKQGNVTMIQRIETRIARIDEEIESIRTKLILKSNCNLKSRLNVIFVKILSTNSRISKNTSKLHMRNIKSSSVTFVRKVL